MPRARLSFQPFSRPCALAAPAYQPCRVVRIQTRRVVRMPCCKPVSPRRANPRVRGGGRSQVRVQTDESSPITHIASREVNSSGNSKRAPPVRGGRSGGPPSLCRYTAFDDRINGPRRSQMGTKLDERHHRLFRPASARPAQVAPGHAHHARLLGRDTDQDRRRDADVRVGHPIRPSAPPTLDTANDATAVADLTRCPQR